MNPEIAVLLGLGRFADGEEEVSRGRMSLSVRVDTSGGVLPAGNGSELTSKTSPDNRIGRTLEYLSERI